MIGGLGILYVCVEIYLEPNPFSDGLKPVQFLFTNSVVPFYYCLFKFLIQIGEDGITYRFVLLSPLHRRIIVRECLYFIDGTSEGGDGSCVLVATSDMVLEVKFHLFDLLDCLGVSLAQSIDDDGLEQDDSECDDDCYFHVDGSFGVNGFGEKALG